MQEVRANELGSDRSRTYSSDDRHLVWKRDGAGFRYEYRGVPLGETPAPIDKAAGEVFYSERTAGPWGARLIAEKLRDLPETERDTLLKAMGAGQLDVNGYLDSAGPDLKAETAIWAGLTIAARKGDAWAREQIKSIGVEEGAATAVWVWEFQEYEFGENIVLVSSIAERLGQGVSGEDGDLHIGAVRASLRAALIRRGMDKQKAERIAMGIRRSTLGRERELLPFAEPENSA